MLALTFTMYGGIISTPHSPENLILGIWFQDQQLKLKVLPILMIQSKLCMSL